MMIASSALLLIATSTSGFSFSNAFLPSSLAAVNSKKRGLTLTSTAAVTPSLSKNPVDKRKQSQLYASYLQPLPSDEGQEDNISKPTLNANANTNANTSVKTQYEYEQTLTKGIDELNSFMKRAKEEDKIIDTELLLKLGQRHLSSSDGEIENVNVGNENVRSEAEQQTRSDKSDQQIEPIPLFKEVKSASSITEEEKEVKKEDTLNSFMKRAKEQDKIIDTEKLLKLGQKHLSSSTNNTTAAKIIASQTDIGIEIEQKTENDESDNNTVEAIPFSSSKEVIQSSSSITEQEEVIQNAEELVSSTIQETLSSSFTPKTSHTYLATRLLINESRTRNEKRVQRSANTLQKRNVQVQEIEFCAQEKITLLQQDIDQEMKRIYTLLQTQLQFERQREEQLLKLINTIHRAQKSKRIEIDTEKRTIAEMLLLKKMENQSMASKLDVLMAQKKALGVLDQCQLDDLTDLLEESMSTLTQVQSSIELTHSFMNDTVMSPLSIKGSGKHDDATTTAATETLLKLEKKWKDTSDGIAIAEARFEQMKETYDSDRLNKLLLLGESIPSSLEPVAKKINSENQSAANIVQAKMKQNTLNIDSNTVSSYVNASILSVADLESKNEKELVGMLAESMEQAIVASAKAGVFGIKALIETFNEEEVSEVTSKVFEKPSVTKDSTKMIDFKDKDAAPLEINNDLKSMNDLKDGIESTRHALSTLGRAGLLIAKKLGSASSTSQATDALKESSGDLIQAFNAVTAISKKRLLNKSNQNKPDKDEEYTKEE